MPGLSMAEPEHEGRMEDRQTLVSSSVLIPMFILYIGTYGAGGSMPAHACSMATSLHNISFRSIHN